MNRSLAILGLVLIIVAVFGHPILAQLSTVSCGTVNATFVIKDGDTSLPIPGATVSVAGLSATTDSSGMATINGIQTSTATGDATISTSGYYTGSIAFGCIGNAGQTQSQTFYDYMAPTSIINVGGTSTSTFTSVGTTTLTTTSVVTTTSNGTPTTSSTTVTTTMTSTTSFVVPPGSPPPTRNTTYEQAGLGFIGLVLIGLAFVKKKGKTV